MVKIVNCFCFFGFFLWWVLLKVINFGNCWVISASRRYRVAFHWKFAEQ